MELFNFLKFKTSEKKCEEIGFLSIRVEIAALVFLSIAFITAAKFWLDRVERLAIQEGTLTDRRK